MEKLIKKSSVIRPVLTNLRILIPSIPPVKKNLHTNLQVYCHKLDRQLAGITVYTDLAPVVLRRHLSMVLPLV
jgi:hypothetical protein